MAAQNTGQKAVKQAPGVWPAAPTFLPSPSATRQTSSVVCFYCDRRGHIARSCWRPQDIHKFLGGNRMLLSVVVVFGLIKCFPSCYMCGFLYLSQFFFISRLQHLYFCNFGHLLTLLSVPRSQLWSCTTDSWSGSVSAVFFPFFFTFFFATSLVFLVSPFNL